MPELALTRGVSPAIAACELTFRDREPIDHHRAVAQHRAYSRLLEGLGLTVEELPADPDLPDCCFVEDIAVVLDEVAVITRPGAESRRGEVDAVAHALGRYRPLARIEAPARIDGGDVLRVRRRLYVGATARTDEAGIAALAEAVRPFDYQVVPVEVRGCLHLKSCASAIGDGTLLVHPEGVDLAPFRGLELVAVPTGEPWAANVLRVGRSIVVHSAFSRTMDLLSSRGLDVRPLDVSEFLKAEAGLTCKSLLFRA